MSTAAAASMSEGRRRRAHVVWIGASLLSVALLAGAFGVAGAAPPGGSSAATVFAAVPSPIAVAATPHALLVLSGASCSAVYAVSAGGAVAPFATLVPSANKCTEGAIAISPGLGNFPSGEVYVLENGALYALPAGGSPVPIAASETIANLSGTYPAQAFDYSGSFGNALLATGGKYGNAYAIGPTGDATFLGAFGTTVEGPSVAPLDFGAFGGDLMVASEGKSPVYAMAPGPSHPIQVFSQWPDSEAVSFVPGLSCSYATTGDAYFVADYSANEILTLPSATLRAYAGSALLLGEYKGVGVGIVGASGALAGSLPIPGTLEGAAYVTCPVGIAQAIDLTSQGFDTINGSDLNVIGFDPASGQLVGADPTGAPSQIFLLDGATGQFDRNVSVGLAPSSVAYNPKSNVLYVANRGSDNLTLLNASSYAELGSVSTAPGAAPVGVAYNAQNTKLYVANAGDWSVEVFSLANNLFPNQNQLIALPGAPAALVADPVGVAFDSEDGLVAVVGGDGTLSILAGTSIVAAFVLGQDPGPLVYDPVSNLVYAAADVSFSGVDPRIILGGST